MPVVFLGCHLATPLDLKMESTRVTSRSWSGKVSEAGQPDDALHLIAAIVPDHHGAANIAGRIGAHLNRYGTAKPWSEKVPLQPGTLDADQADRTVRAKTAAGVLDIPASGSVDGVHEGLFITFGSQKRVYEVRSASGNTVTLNRPLETALDRGDAINWQPTIDWVWGIDSVNNPPVWTRGINVGIGWLLDAWEAV